MKKPKPRTLGAEPLEERLPVSSSAAGVLFGFGLSQNEPGVERSATPGYETSQTQHTESIVQQSIPIDLTLDLQLDAIAVDLVHSEESLDAISSPTEDPFVLTPLTPGIALSDTNNDPHRELGDELLLFQISTLDYGRVDTTPVVSLPLVGDAVRAANREFWQNAFLPDSWHHDHKEQKFEAEFAPIRPLRFYDSRCEEAPQVDGAMLIDLADDADEEPTEPTRLGGNDGSGGPGSGGSGGTPTSVPNVSVTLKSTSPTEIVEHLGIPLGSSGGAGSAQQWFTFTMAASLPSGHTNTLQYVELQLNGTATHGSDYKVYTMGNAEIPVSNGKFTLPTSGGDTTDFKVVPIDDTLVEDNETITLSIVPKPAGPSGGYIVGYTDVGGVPKVTIIDDDRLRVDLDVDSDNDGTLDRSDEEDKIEMNSPGKLIRASKTSAVENRVPMVLEISGTCIVTSSATVAISIPSPFHVYTGTGTEIVSDTYKLSQLELTPGEPLTLYVGAEAPSAVGEKITVTVDPDGPGPLSTENDIVALTSYDLKIDARNSITLPDGSKAAPLMWNDNWDCKQTYPAGVVGHRQHEPVWDWDYDPAIYGPLENADPDLMSTFITIMPADLPGTFEFEFGDGVKLWENNLKSAPIEAGTPYSAATVPKSFYTEGIEVGSENVTLVYKYNGNTIDTETLRADVVWLKAEQGGIIKVQKVINENGQDITFTVVGLPPEYTCQWDLDGDGIYNSGNWENMNTSTAVVKYSPASSKAGNICLPEDVNNPEECIANRRKEYEVTVKMTGGYVLPLMFKTIRVAQAGYQGTALDGALRPGETDPDDPEVVRRRRIEIAKLIIPLPPMDPLPLFGPCSATELDKKYGTALWTKLSNTIIQYSTQGGDDDAYACVGRVGRGVNMEHYYVNFSYRAYNTEFKHEDFVALAQHEVRHVNQMIEMATQGTKWNIIDSNYSDYKDIAYYALYEADADIGQLTSQASWKFIATECLLGFYMNYNVAIAFYNNLLNPDPNVPMTAIDRLATAAATKSILQDIYVAIPFIEMKKDGYDWYVMAPQ